MIHNFYDFINERYEINSLPNNVILLSKLSESDGNIFMLYNKSKRESIGYISFGLYDIIGSYTVGGAYSEHGYGAFLYECAMTYVYPNALSMSRSSGTSGDAIDVWDKFLKRDDVRHERMNSDEITHKQEDWIEGGLFDDDPEYRQSIFDLEDTRFYYTFGKEKLDNLIEIGNSYAEKNSISPLDIEYMQYDLE